MSQIFDALQRSEAERSGKDPAASALAAELLQRTDRFAQFKWGSANSQDNRDATSEVSSVAVVDASQEAIEDRGTDAKEELPCDLAHCEAVQTSARSEGHLVCLPENESPAGEAFHLLGVRLKHLRRQRPLKKLLITSTIPQEGKSMVAANLACTLATETQQRVLLIEGDVRIPTQSKIFGIHQKPGIVEWIRGERALAKCIYRLEGASIWFMPAGTSTGNSAELLESGMLAPMIEKLSGWFDWVVIDSPPVLPLADTSVWASLVDGILLVTRQGTTQKRELKRGLEALGSQKLIGALVNSSEGASKADYYYRPSGR
jgi:capsular exopolysaccharide synthesis family protein